MSVLKLTKLSPVQQYFEPNDKDKYNNIPKRNNLSKIICFLVGYAGTYKYSGTTKEINFYFNIDLVRTVCNANGQDCWGGYHEYYDYLQGRRLIFFL